MPAPLNDTCLSCHLAGRPGATYTGASPYGLRLDTFFLCNDCVTVGFAVGICAACKQAETPERPSNEFKLQRLDGAGGPAPFWLHNDCTPLAGPPQGITQTYLDEMDRIGH
jgi:hypothetical protein